MSKTKVFTRTGALGTNTQIMLKCHDGECECRIYDYATLELYEHTIKGDLKDGFKWCLKMLKYHERTK